MPWWALAWPILSWAVLAVDVAHGMSPWLEIVSAAAMTAAVFAAVYHAEVVAHRLGEPFGTLVLAVAVTVIEVALIVSVMIGGGPDKAALPRDTAFAAVMIICNGLVGLSLLMGGLRHREQAFQLQGALAALAVLAALVTLTLVLPTVAVAHPGPVFSNTQLAFAGVASLVLYASFVFVQTVRHRDYFLPPGGGTEEDHAVPPSAGQAALSLGLLVVALIGVIGLAKALTPTLERVIAEAGAPKALVGIVIAMIVLLPESLSALRAARLNRLQTSVNLALGSALASIGLTIPAVAVVSFVIGQPLALGLDAMQSVLLLLTLFVGLITLSTGRTTVLQGIVHLVIFFAFLFFAVVP
jgi:Ca2+:H+ antiporter